MAKHKYANKKSGDFGASKAPEAVKKTDSASLAAEPAQEAPPEAPALVPEGKNGRLSVGQKGELILNPVGRAPVVDNMRGGLILSMMIMGYAFIHAYAPDFFQNHSTLPGMNLRDVITPLLLFTVALSLGISFRKRAKQYGVKPARKYILTRGLIYIAFGYLFNSFLWLYVFLKNPDVAWNQNPMPWDILQSVGAGIFTASFFIHLKNRHKLIAAGVLLLIQYLLVLFFPSMRLYLIRVLANPVIRESTWGELTSFFSFGALLLVYNVLSDLAFRTPKKFAVTASVLVAAGVGCLVYSVSIRNSSNLATLDFLKNPFVVYFPTISFGYILVGAAIGSLGIALMLVVNLFYDKNMFLLGSVGRNSLLAFLLYLISLRFVNPFIDSQAVTNADGSKSLPFYIPFFIMLVMVSAIGAIMTLLDKKKIYLKL